MQLQQPKHKTLEMLFIHPFEIEYTFTQQIPAPCLKMMIPFSSLILLMLLLLLLQVLLPQQQQSDIYVALLTCVARGILQKSASEFQGEPYWRRQSFPLLNTIML
mmetsp:Transcript_17257/g.27940  ORF Transcript_17257/g.27940 Transcript_17257/m.27940 type:complete len:105 (-) Transcript_17257:64-378(-)